MQKRLKIGWGGGSGKLYAVGYRGSVVFCTHGGFVVIRYPPILENEQATDSAGSYDDRRRWVSPQTAHQAVQASVMFTCTIATLVGNISRSHEELTGILGPMVAAGRGALNSNFGHYCQARYERFLKRPKPPPRRRERKRQGDASCFNSALEVSIIPGPDDNSPPAVIAVLRKNPGKYYAVKCFPSRGYTQVPGVISPDLSDGFFAATIWARFLTEAGIGINPALLVTVIGEWPIMVNYKFLRVRWSDHVVLNLAHVVEYLKSMKESGEGLPFPIWEIKHPQDSLNMSFKFVCPCRKKVRVNVFYWGKVNILGARDTESPLAICDYLSAFFHAHWSEFVVLQPLPDKAKWGGVAVARFLTFLRLREFAKMVAEILVALTKNALSSEPQGRLGWGPARGALAW